MFYNAHVMGKGDWARELELDPFTTGFVLGLLVGEGHFGGDGQQAQVTVRMHVRHHQLLKWLESTFPGSKTYGPYVHNGRHYMQWMARGPVLYDVIVPLVGRHLESIDDHVTRRFRQMCDRYGLWWYPDEPRGTLGLRELPSGYRSTSVA